MIRRDDLSQTVDEFLAGIDALPTPSPVVIHILRCEAVADRDMRALLKLIAAEPALSARVIDAAGTALDVPAGGVASVEEAAAVIGPESFRSFVLTASIVGMFDTGSKDGEFHESFWRHSLVAAFAARILIGALCPGDAVSRELAFAGGLLHDMGKMVLFRQARVAYGEVAKLSEAHPESELETERQAFGFDHARVGSALMLKWNLPDTLCLAIGHHHDPLAVSDRTLLVDVLHVADALSYHLLAMGREDLAAPAMKPEVFDRSGLKLEDVGRHMEALKEDLFRASAFQRLVRPDPGA
jgi:HD-like signal output (HDOD) protein